MRRIGLQNVRLVETPGNPGRLRRLARRPGRADDPLLRPLRRAAGRSARALGVAAVRGDRPRRRDLRARRRRRQGAGLHALQGDRGAPEAERPAAGEHQDHPRRRRGSRLGATSTTSSRRTSDELAADVVVISDSPMFDRGMPSICYGLRGLVYFQIDLRGTKSDLHSGSFGGAVANPAMVLAQILAQMKDRGGRIKIPGFYDDVRELTRRGARRSGSEAAVQREALPQGARRAEAVRRERLHDARARVGAADVRGQRPAVRLHRRRREDRDSGGRDGEGQHAARARTRIPNKIARAVRGLRARRSRRRPSR